jgi:hypothetical protein
MMFKRCLKIIIEGSLAELGAVEMYVIHKMRFVFVFFIRQPAWLNQLPVLCNLYTKCDLTIRRKQDVKRLILLEISTFHLAEPEKIVRFLQRNDAAQRFDWPAFLRALGNRPDKSPQWKPGRWRTQRSF